MPRLDNEGLVVTFDMLELAASLYGLLGGGIDAAGVLAEVEGGFTHDILLSLCPCDMLFEINCFVNTYGTPTHIVGVKFSFEFKCA